MIVGGDIYQMGKNIEMDNKTPTQQERRKSGGTSLNWALGKSSDDVGRGILVKDQRKCEHPAWHLNLARLNNREELCMAGADKNSK